MQTIPELIGLDSLAGTIRIPPEWDVPLTERVRRLIDTAPFRRLAKIGQLGLVPLIYPAAHHKRFEHSLGVYRLALLVLKRLLHDKRFREIVTKKDAELLIATALLHDIGHAPFCHPIEDIRLENFPRHEIWAQHQIEQGEIASLLQDDWEIDPKNVTKLLKGETDGQPVLKLLGSILSGPIDIDKMDYLYRDSLHAGVPYGRNLDQSRLIASLCVNEAGDGLAITEKGKTAAELMVFARYIMFSEVYWHHAVRSATAMVQRLFAEIYRSGNIDINRFFQFSDDEAIQFFREQAAHLAGTPALAEELFGTVRSLYKRVAQFSLLEQPEIYRKLAGKPYHVLCELSDQLSEQISKRCPDCPQPAVLIDSPPVEKEVEIKIDVYYPKEKRYRPLDEVSPVVRAMAKEQFDDIVKRVRVFAHPQLAAQIDPPLDWTAMLEQVY